MMFSSHQIYLVKLELVDCYLLYKTECLKSDVRCPCPLKI